MKTLLFVLAISFSMTCVFGLIQTQAALKIRVSPSTQSIALGLLALNSSIAVDCQTIGEEITNGPTKSNLWYHVPSRRGYISAAYVNNTGKPFPVCSKAAPKNATVIPKPTPKNVTVLPKPAVNHTVNHTVNATVNNTVIPRPVHKNTTANNTVIPRPVPKNVTVNNTVIPRPVPKNATVIPRPVHKNATANNTVIPRPVHKNATVNNTVIPSPVPKNATVIPRPVPKNVTAHKNATNSTVAPKPAHISYNCTGGLKTNKTCAQAVAWAESKLSTVPSDEFARKADRFVGNAYGKARSGFESAIVHWEATPEQHKHSDRNPPAGALVYFKTGTAGYVTISTGNGDLIGTDIAGVGTVTRTSIAGVETKWRAVYLGWAAPYFKN